jgi:RHS repeat-associated protein
MSVVRPPTQPPSMTGLKMLRWLISLVFLMALSVSANSERFEFPEIFDPPDKRDLLPLPPLAPQTMAAAPASAAAITEGIEIQMVWQSYYADLDLYLFNSEEPGACYYANTTTSWGCIYNYDNWGGRRSSDPFPYAEQITVDLDSLRENNACTYAIWVNYYDWWDGMSPSNVPASLDLYFFGELAESFPITLSGPRTSKKVWEGCVGELELLVIIYDEDLAQDNDCPDENRQGLDPIDMASGAQTLEHHLLSVQGVLPISFDLQYNSMLLKKRATGRGWEDQRFSASLEQLDNGDVKVNWTTNRYNIFTRNADGQFESPHSACQFDTLVENADGSFTLERKKQQVVYQFNANGQMVAQANRQGQFLNFSYDNAGRLAQVTEPVSGVFLNYAYNSAGFLERVTDPLGRQATLGYDDRGHLTTVTDAAGQTTTYTYNNRGQILSSTNADGVQRFSNTFDDDHRVIAQANSLGQLSQLSYDLESQPGKRITTLTNRLGETRSYTFDEHHKLLQLTNELGHSAVYTYNAKGQRTSATDANGNTHSFDYDANGNLTTITDAAQHQTQLAYDDHNNLRSVTNALGKALQFSYDDSHNLTRITDPLANVTDYTYNSDKQVVSKTSPRQGVTTYAYANGLPIRVTNPEGVVYTLGYDAAGRLTSITDADNNTTTLTYDGVDRLTSVTNPLGHSVSMTYNSRNNLLTFTDANGNITTRTYDGNGNLISQINALGQETRYEYDAEERLTHVIDAKNGITQLGYDASGRLISITNPLGQTQTLEYDAADNLLKRVDAFGKQVMSLNYDELNNLTEVSDALANRTTFDYDALSRLVQSTDPVEAVTQFRYDDLNCLVESVDALTGVSSQGFDADGNRNSLTDPNSNETRFDFDKSGRLVQETLATADQVNYTYNARNLLAQVTNGRGQQRQFEYDAAGRITRWTDPDGTVSYTYDANGNVLTVTDSNGTITREYDQLNRVTKYTDSQGNTLQYAYDEVGNLVTLTYPDGKQVHYDYDAANQLIKVTDWAGRETHYEYDLNGRLIKTLRPNGTQMTRVYDDAGQLVQQKEVIISQFDFVYDAAGDIVQEKITPEPNLEVNPLSMTYAAANRLATYDGSAVQLDADGNMRFGPLSGGMANFVFESRNRLVAAGNTAYRYDAENQRTAVSIDGQETRYVINSQPLLSQVLVRTQPDGTQTYYVSGLGLIGQEKQGQYLSYHFDLRGSTVALTDETGQVVERFQYSPYGLLLDGDASITPFLFNGMYGVMTDSNGLYYMRARYYHPEIRRFVNQDILLGDIFEGQTLNRYAFVTGQPVSFVDPFGLVGENVISTICGVALIEPTPVGEVACICALIAVGGLIVHSTSNTPTTTSRPFVAPGEGIEWPGDCNEDYLNHLQKQKGLLCDVPRRCHKRNETCQNVEAKMLAGYQCRAIRLKIMDECFRGGDKLHREELKNVNDVLSKCGVIALKVCP